MKVIRVILAILLVSLAAYGLITGEYGVLPYIGLLSGAMLVVWAISEFQENRKTVAVLFLLLSGFLLSGGILLLLS